MVNKCKFYRYSTCILTSHPQADPHIKQTHAISDIISLFLYSRNLAHAHVASILKNTNKTIHDMYIQSECTVQMYTDYAFLPEYNG